MPDSLITWLDIGFKIVMIPVGIRWFLWHGRESETAKGHVNQSQLGAVEQALNLKLSTLADSVKTISESLTKTEARSQENTTQIRKEIIHLHELMRADANAVADTLRHMTKDIAQAR